MKPRFINPSFSAMVVIAVLVVSGCASRPPAEQALLAGTFMDRAQSQTAREITVRAAVPGAKESQELFGIPLYRRGVQPVWLEITNRSEDPVFFLPVGLDPGYYTPIEAQHRVVNPSSQARREVLNDQRLFRAGMDLQIQPGESRSGYIFSSLDEGTKAFNVDISSRDFFESFTFFIPVPGLRVDHYNADWDAIYPQDDIQDVDQAALIAWLESQPCCATDKAGKGSADPLNLVIIGDLKDVYVAFIRSGWDETETITSGTAWKTVKSFIGGGEYRYSPVSGLYLFGRPQDVAFQKARDNIHERNHLRLWLAPVRYEGKRVWMGQISRDIGVRFTKKTITTHKIDPQVDETREFLLEDLAYAQALDAFAYVGGVGRVTLDAPRGNLTGDPWFSDGYRLVMWVTSEPNDIRDVKYIHWRDSLADRPR